MEMSRNFDGCALLGAGTRVKFDDVTSLAGTAVPQVLTAFFRD